MPVSAVITDDFGSYTPVDPIGAMPAAAFDTREIAADGAGRRWSWRFAGGALVAGTLLVAGTVAGNAGRTSRLRADASAVLVAEEAPAPQATWVQGQTFKSQAPTMDVDVQYIGAQGWGTNFDHIPTPEMCAAMCWGVEQCAAYTWVKDAGLPGCPSQCWLMAGVAEKKPLKGLVSGVPPARPQFTPPPAVKKAASGTLYCFALIQPTGYEKGLLQWQMENKASLFGCDKAAVYSNERISLGNGVVTEVVNSTLKCGYGGDSQTALNAWIFIAVWYQVIHVGDYKNYDWVVKIDPDAVFFPHRLSALLANHQGAGYINNCKYGMHGPIEVFSSKAITALATDYKSSWDGKAPKTCVSSMDFGLWGEDMFIDQCLGKVLKVGPIPLDAALMCEAHCDCPSWYWCNEGSNMVSYHPFKSIESYQTCMANALKGESPAKLLK